MVKKQRKRIKPRPATLDNPGYNMCNEQEREFAEKIAIEGKPAAQAWREVYGQNSSKKYKALACQNGYKVRNREHVKMAISELQSKAVEQVLKQKLAWACRVTEFADNVEEIAHDTYHKDRLKANLAVLDRVMPAAQHIKMEVDINSPQVRSEAVRRGLIERAAFKQVLNTLLQAGLKNAAPVYLALSDSKDVDEKFKLALQCAIEREKQALQDLSDEELLVIAQQPQLLPKREEETINGR